jgi:hypothetical protein
LKHSEERWIARIGYKLMFGESAGAVVAEAPGRDSEEGVPALKVDKMIFSAEDEESERAGGSGRVEGAGRFRKADVAQEVERGGGRFGGIEEKPTAGANEDGESVGKRLEAGGRAAACKKIEAPEGREGENRDGTVAEGKQEVTVG